MTTVQGTENLAKARATSAAQSERIATGSSDSFTLLHKNTSELTGPLARKEPAGVSCLVQTVEL